MQVKICVGIKIGCSNLNLRNRIWLSALVGCCHGSPTPKSLLSGMGRPQNLYVGGDCGKGANE